MKSKISILLFSLSTIAFPQKDIQILSSDQNSILIQYTPIYLDTSATKIGNQEYLNIDLNLGYTPDSEEWGMPAIPERRLNIGVPMEFGNTIDIISTEYKELNGSIIPKPRMVPDRNLNKYEYQLADNYNEYEETEEVVLFGEFGIARGINSQTIRMLPVKFYPADRKIRLYKKILFRINYAKGGEYSEHTYDELQNSAVINYNQARFWQEKRKTTKKATVTSSVLATGNWVKFEAGKEEGMYIIDYNFLTSAGFNPSEIDPRTIKIYNNGGKVLSENINDERPIDLVENAVRVVGEQDGIFNQGDYILFYGKGSNFWDFDEFSGGIKRFHHPYSEHNYYWITYGGSNGKRIQNEAGLNTTPGYHQNSTEAFTDYEEDKINLGKTGREYFGDDFSQTVSSRTYINTLNGRLSSDPIKYKFRFVNASDEYLTLKVSENNQQIFNQQLAGYSGNYIIGKDYIREVEFNNNLPDNRSTLKFSFSSTAVNAIGYLDYFEIHYKKDLKAYDNKLLFFSDDTSAIIEYYIHNFTSTNIEVFDISDYANVKVITNHVLLSGGDCKFQILESQGIRSKYYAVGDGNYLTPTNPVSVDNSDLRGIQTGAKYIIITPKEFQDAANRLKEYRENEALLPVSSIVVDVDEIFNEFSCGILDVSAIRDFIKYSYDNWNITPGYVLLFGKGTFDYKNVEGFDDNFVPTWQTQESLRLIDGTNSYTSDDFFVMVDGANSNKIDLAPGRITITNETEADNCVSKIIDYEQNSKKGNWKNLITLVADDGLTTTGDDHSLHTDQMEQIANSWIPKSFDLKKLYLADYPAIITGAGRRKPQVNADLITAINNGTLLINYIGHGNPEVWTHEVVFEKSVTIPQLNNSEYFFLVAATCDFAHYDIPNFKSGSDELILKPNAGAIASLSAGRLVYSQSNYQLNRYFMSVLLNEDRDTLNLIRTIGDSYFTTKQSYYGTNDRKYHLFGDPLLRLQVPRYFGNIDSVNGQTLDANVQVKALSKTEIAGTILTPDDEVWQDFNGEGILTVFDSERTKYLEQIGNYPMIIPGGVIFRGRVSVNNGEFRANFVVPKDISYENKNGKIIFYFFDQDKDGLAYTRSIIVGGTDTTAVNDGEGPEIEIFFDNDGYYNAYLVGPEPELIVKLTDETGLNTTGTGVGHKLEGILNNDDVNPIDFTNYFTGELDAAGKSGEINYKFNRLEEGDYDLLVKAWDVFNNFSSEETIFSVVGDDQLVIRDVYNYPNPFKSYTTFTFQHNLNKPVNVDLKIYTIAGRMIKNIKVDNIDQKFVKVDWDGRDEDGDMISNGTYLYKILVRTTDGEFKQDVLGKMAVVR